MSATNAGPEQEAFPRGAKVTECKALPEGVEDMGDIFDCLADVVASSSQIPEKKPVEDEKVYCE